MPPRFIYFDLGNVLLKFDSSLACRQLANATGATPDRVRRFLFDDNVQNDFEVGRLNNEQFCERLRNQFSSDASDASLLHACSAMFELNEPIVPIVSGLTEAGYRLGILSNTCHAHWDYIVRKYDSLIRHFRRHILSYEEKAMKPNARIYQAAARVAGCSPQEIFFMDDRSENVDGAVAFGLDAVQFSTADELRRELSKRRVQI